MARAEKSAIEMDTIQYKAIHKQSFAAFSFRRNQMTTFTHTEHLYSASSRELLRGTQSLPSSQLKQTYETADSITRP